MNKNVYVWAVIAVLIVVAVTLFLQLTGEAPEIPEPVVNLPPLFATYESNIFNYTVQYPKDWEFNGGGALVAFVGPLGDQNFSTNIYVRVEETGFNNSEAALIDKLGEINWDLDQYRYFKNETPVSLNISGAPALETVHSYTIMYYEIKQITLLVYKDYIYSIVYTSVESSYDDYFWAYEKAKETFEFI